MNQPEVFKGFKGHYKAYKGYKEPTREDLELLRSKLKDLVSEAKRILQRKKGIHGYNITPFVSDEIELAFNCLCEAEELFDEALKLHKKTIK